MQKTAQIMENPEVFHQVVMRKYLSWRIGPYTAGAIASIAFGLARPAVDGNVTRVLARLFEVDYVSGSDNQDFQAMMEILISRRPGDFNQADGWDRYWIASQSHGRKKSC